MDKVEGQRLSSLEVDIADAKKDLRKLCDRSTANKAALMAIPRPIAQAWSDAGFNCLEMLFDGDKLVITPQRS